MDTQEQKSTTQDLWKILNSEYEQAVQEAEKYVQWYEQRERTFEGSSTLLNDVPPGRYEVKVIAKKGQQTSSDVKVVEILPGAMANIEMTLPVS